MFGIKKRTRLKETVAVLAKEVATLKEMVAELSRRTVTQMTTEQEPPVPFSQIMDEWLNGEEGKSGEGKDLR